MKKIKGILIDVDNNQVKVVEVNNDLDDIRKLIRCKYIDIIRRPVHGKEYTFVIDDEGLLPEAPIPSCVSSERVEIVGNTFVVNDNCSGDDIASLNDDDIELIQKNIVSTVLKDKNTNKQSEIKILAIY